MPRALWREEAKLINSVESSQEEFKKYERSLHGTIDKATTNGLAALDKIVEKLSLQEQVYGPMYKLFDVEEVYQTAVEVVGGSSLFHVVVDTDETATKILQQMNREKSGRVTFMPLNRLRPKTMAFPSTTDAIPMIQKLKFNDLYKAAFEQVCIN